MKETDIPYVEASDFTSALAFCNHVHTNKISLPVRVRLCASTFILTKDNFNLMSLGVLMAAEWKAKDE